MPSASDLKMFSRTQASGIAPPVVPPMPVLPEDVKKRFPSMAKWHNDMKEWVVKLNLVIRPPMPPPTS